MAFRSNATPMDFEYQDGVGPVDHRSPFAKLSANSQRSFASNTESPSKRRGGAAVFGSPSKSLNDYSASLSPTKPPSPTKFDLRGSVFTPRRPTTEAASSGGETPKSPEQSFMDSDATPDNSTNFRNAPVYFDSAKTPAMSPTKAHNKPLTNVTEKESREKRRDSWLWRAASYVTMSPSSNPAPGKGEVARGPLHDADHKIVKKAQKKRRGDTIRQLMRNRTNSVSESEESRPPSPSKPKRKWGTRLMKKDEQQQTLPAAPNNTPGGIANFFKFLTDHPTLPQILSWYAQLTLNFFLISSLMYILFSFYATIRNDIDKKSTEAVSELVAEMAVCARQYTENRCAPDTRVPAMETVCTNWEKCMNRDTRAMGRAKISVHTWAEVFNAFVEPISWKAMIFSTLLIFGAVALSNLPFSMIRHRAEERAAAANHHHYYGNVPPTPGRQFSNTEQLGYWTPAAPALEPAPSQVSLDNGGRESPTKRLGYR